MDELANEFQKIIEGKKNECTEKCNALKADERADEAKLEKIKLNIYTTFGTVTEVMRKNVLKNNFPTKEEKYTKFCNAVIMSLDNIPANWRTRLEKAKANDDTENIVICQTQLDVADELKKIFIELSTKTA